MYIVEMSNSRITGDILSVLVEPLLQFVYFINTSQTMTMAADNSIAVSETVTVLLKLGLK